MRVGLIGTGRIGALHAETLGALSGVDEVIVADADTARAEALAERLGGGRAEGRREGRLVAAPGVEEMYAARPDAVVIAAATSAHAVLLHRALDAGVPVFCEKPVALDVPGTLSVAERAAAAGAVPVQIGFQRRFDKGYQAARAALRGGELGWLHTLRACTSDRTPPPASYIPTSGGLFRDCGIHDFDILRWLTGREVETVCAMGANRGDAFFRDGDDVDTCAALLRFDDGVLATVTATRYNGAGHDVRLEVCGSEGTRVVGLDDHAPLPTAEERLSWRRAEPYETFMERFRAAYVAELAAFVEVAAGCTGRTGGRTESPCTVADALEALYVAEACDLSRRTGGPVAVADVRHPPTSRPSGG